MSIFTKLFRKKAPLTVEQQSQVLTPTESMATTVPMIDKSLFTEDRHPSELFPVPDSLATKKSKKSLLEDLKSKNYYAMGMRDGYDDPNFETMNQNVNLIACDYKEVYAVAIQEIDEHLLKIERTLVPQFEEQMPFEYREVKLQKEMLEEHKRDLKQQFDLAALGEGYIEKSVEQYRAGFRKGLRQWTDEVVLFKPFSTL
ncbi:hypothetical protein MMU07_03205 [Aquiflexum sp. LQ15W]|uniref:hypothetical protein n=1 Tax=Cognataquiflexum nitidum TaxID=2922272 RepID=UPI001F142703|nr:hypothetical protein [Cognataquiflexum nitidum]MCH6198573.1 hypothetical protein [Cognataquiflexum nitidum]